jgi:predicted ester cyclase
VSRQEATDATSPADSRAEALKALVRRNTEQIQGQGDFALFDDYFVDHTPQPGTTADKAGVRVLYKRLRESFPDFRPEIHWQTVDGDIVTTFKTYHGTHQGDFLGIAPSGKTIQFETVDAMRVRDRKITDHWGVANLYPATPLPRR